MFALPKTQSDLAPILVSSPTIRAGTTLLQRLLCSASNTIIYGENVAQDAEFFINVFVAKSSVYAMNRARFDAVRANTVEHGSDDWMIDLVPNLDGYLEALQRGSLAGLEYCRADALAQSCTVWGVKCPGWKPPTLTLFRQLLPQSRLIYIYRDVLTAARSAKAWMPAWSDEELAGFCTEWAENLAYALTLAGQPNVLLLRYEDFILDPAASIAQVAAFTGAEGLQESVFGRRINSGNNAYQPPAPLTDHELSIVERIAAPLRTQLYPATS
jgi:hypothetical protein